MPACTFISKRILKIVSFKLIVVFLLSFYTSAYAQDADPNMAAPSNVDSSTPQVPAQNQTPAPPGASENTEDDERNSPYLNYGAADFNSDEEDDTMFFQYGKFFGIGLGVGYQAFTGNRGNLYEPAFPKVDIRAQIWMDFNFAIVLNLAFASHKWVFQGDPWTANFVTFGLDLKYYFDTKDASDALTFSNPFLIGGVESQTKTVSSIAEPAPDTESAFGFNAGAGLEFPIAHKKSYVTIDGRMHFASYDDQYSTQFNPSVEDLTGIMYTFGITFMFVW
jgi:hypothetical protein